MHHRLGLAFDSIVQGSRCAEIVILRIEQKLKPFENSCARQINDVRLLRAKPHVIVIRISTVRFDQ